MIWWPVKGFCDSARMLHDEELRESLDSILEGYWPSYWDGFTQTVHLYGWVLAMEYCARFDGDHPCFDALERMAGPPRSPRPRGAWSEHRRLLMEKREDWYGQYNW